MELIEGLPRAQAALAAARIEEAQPITEAIRESGVVGVLGETEVGKTSTVRQAITPLLGPVSLIYLDLDGAASDEHAAFFLAKEIARAQLGAVGLSLLSADVLRPTRLDAERVALAELLGLDGLDEAMREWPSGEYPLTKALAALETLARSRRILLWVDHVEAPLLTPRHPLQMDRLLWGVRELTQRVGSLGVVLSGREGTERNLVGGAAAFHQQGRWLSIARPPLEVWRSTARELGVATSVVGELTELLQGHPATMLLALVHTGTDSSPRHPYEVVRDMLMSDVGLIGRTVQNARTLHRLGSQVLTQIALGQAPYGKEQRGRAAPQEIRKVLDRLRIAGLLRRGPRGWSLVNPLVEMGLRQQVRLPAIPEPADGDRSPD